ncbi:hypothetical protein V6Z11_A13G221700 [Gossypium hirsutum]
MLAMIGWGEYGAAIDLDSIEVQMNKLFSKGVSTVHANITIDAFDDREEIDDINGWRRRLVSIYSSIFFHPKPVGQCFWIATTTLIRVLAM